MGIVRSLLSVILVSALLFGTASGETLLRVATPGALTGALPIYLGAKKGIFAKYGLAVEVIATRNEQMKTMAYEDPSFTSIPPYKFFDLSLIQELKSESK